MTAQQLKNSVLQLAVQGKLVPQDPNDEPVEIVPCMGDTPFDVPKNWVWARLGDAFNMHAGKFVKACDIYEDNNSGRYPCYGGNGLRGYVDTFNTEGSFPLIGRQGALCGNINMAKGRFYATEHAVVAKPNTGIDVNWAFYALISLNLNQYSTATAQPGLAVSKISNVPISIPPLAEQHRIVAHIEDLLPHIADYDAAEQKLTMLNATFPDHLKKSILQAAVQGKLVPQDENDEPASVLLERIQAEKEQLIKVGKIKKEKPLPPITEDGIPFDVPESWTWVRLEMLSVNIHYGFTASAAELGNAKLLRITDIQDNIVQWDTVPFCNPSDREFSVYGLQNRDIMIARTGGTIGKSYIVRNLSERAVFASYLIRVIPLLTVYEEYIKVFLETPLYWAQLKRSSMGTGQPNVNGQSLKALMLPLPPLAEQRRIVTKCDELMAMVDCFGGNSND